MDITYLVDKYFKKIEIEDADFVPINNFSSEVPYLSLILPIEMLKEYSRIINQEDKLPDGKEFWKKTDLENKLKNSDKYHGQGHITFLSDVLCYLEENSEVRYEKLNSSEKIRMTIKGTPKKTI